MVHPYVDHRMWLNRLSCHLLLPVIGFIPLQSVITCYREDTEQLMR